MGRPCRPDRLLRDRRIPAKCSGDREPTRNAIHDDSQQPKGFAYVSGIIDPTSRLTAILGASRGTFQIPQVGGQSPTLGLTVNGINDFASASLRTGQGLGVFALQFCPRRTFLAGLTQRF
jgi:hypothetical protein